MIGFSDNLKLTRVLQKNILKDIFKYPISIPTKSDCFDCQYYRDALQASNSWSLKMKPII